MKDYEILSTIGSGGSGEVFKIRRNNTGILYAAKRFSCEEEGRREAERLQKLNHPGIPKTADYFSEEGYFWLVMEYEEGKTLEEYAKENYKRLFKRKSKGIPSGEKIIEDLSEILKYLHSLPVPVIHGDLKPSNIFITEKGEIKLLDFGSARKLYEDDTEIYSTKRYAAPEQYMGECTLRSDVYAFGYVMIYVLSGKEPGCFKNKPDKGMLLRLGMKENFAEVAFKCIYDNPVKRYASAKELNQALKRMKRGALMKQTFEKTVSLMLTDGGSILALSGYFLYFLKGVQRGRFFILAGCVMLLVKMISDSNGKNERAGEYVTEYSLFLRDE